MNRRTNCFLVFPIILGAFMLFQNGFASEPETPVAEAQMLANTCIACHGPAGASLGPASPNIAGLSEDYFIETMLAYQNDKRAATIMNRIARGYNNEEIRRLAGYFAKQPALRPQQNVEKDKARLGKKLHKKFCIKCHFDAGSDPDDDAGLLSGQWQAYLRYTLADFYQGNRPMHVKKKQRLDKLMKQHGNDGLEALIHFYSSEFAVSQQVTP